MTCWRLKLDYLFNTIPNSFTIFNIFKEIITETKKTKQDKTKNTIFFKNIIPYTRRIKLTVT